MEILAGGDRRAILKIRIWRGYHDGIWLAQLVEETGWTKSAIESELADVIRNGEVVRIGEMFMHAPAWELLKSQVVPTVADFHRENPLASGIGKEELRDRTDAGDEAFEAITEILVREQKIEISGDLVRLPGRGVVMKDEEAESKKTIEDSLRLGRVESPGTERCSRRIESGQSSRPENCHAPAARQSAGKDFRGSGIPSHCVGGLAEASGVRKDEIAKHRRRPLQGSDRGKPEVRYPAAGISRSRACYPAGGG